MKHRLQRLRGMFGYTDVLVVILIVVVVLILLGVIRTR